MVSSIPQLFDVGSGQNRHSQAVGDKTRSENFNAWTFTTSTANTFGAEASFPIVRGPDRNYLTFAENSMTPYFTVCSITRSTQPPPTCGALMGLGSGGMKSIFGIGNWAIPLVKVGDYARVLQTRV